MIIKRQTKGLQLFDDIEKATANILKVFGLQCFPQGRSRNLLVGHLDHIFVDSHINNVWQECQVKGLDPLKLLLQFYGIEIKIFFRDIGFARRFIARRRC